MFQLSHVLITAKYQLTLTEYIYQEEKPSRNQKAQSCLGLKHKFNSVPFCKSKRCI